MLSGSVLVAEADPTLNLQLAYRALLEQKQGHGHFKSTSGEARAVELQSGNGLVAGLVAGSSVLLTVFLFFWHHICRGNEGVVPDEEVVETAPPYVVVASESDEGKDCAHIIPEGGKVVQKADTHVILEQEHSTLFKHVISFRPAAKDKGRAPHGLNWLTWITGRLCSDVAAPTIIGLPTLSAGAVAGRLEGLESDQTDTASTSVSLGTSSSIESLPDTPTAHNAAPSVCSTHDPYGRLSVKDDSMIQPLQMELVPRPSSDLQLADGDGQRAVGEGPGMRTRSASFPGALPSNLTGSDEGDVDVSVGAGASLEA
uniref:Uncharacterized protein n=1 Tax=Vitrella brassicaformis TaxID=1169539 RepID=A0A7S1JST6_9ALVE